MQGFDFNTFRVGDANRIAFEMCREVAALCHDGPSLLVLLGASGTGKSHLLWSIVKEVRASAAKAGLALILAREFPQKVRDLVKDPRPIQQGKPAILLVDELDQFAENVADLEAVVRVFWENGHRVVMASAVHPARLTALSDPFKASLEQARLIEIKRIDAAPQKTDAADAPVPSNCDGVEMAAFRRELESVGRERDALAQRATEADSQVQALSERQTALEAELASLRDEKEALQQRVAEQDLAEAEHRVLRDQLGEAQAEAEAAFAEQARLQGLLGAHQGIEEALREAHAERDRLREQVRTQAQTLLDQVQTCRATYAGGQHMVAETLQRFLSEFQAQDAPLKQWEGARLAHAQLEDARTQAESLQAHLEEERRSFEAALAEARGECEYADGLLDEARAEQGRLGVALDAARGRLGVLEFELQKARKQLVLQVAEMDALRHEAAAQVASANIQAGEMDHRLARFESALDVARQLGRAAGADVRRLDVDLSRAAHVLRELLARLETLREIAIEDSAPAEPDFHQAPLFDASLFESLPAVFESLPGHAEARGAHQSGSLMAVVEQALAGDDEATGAIAGESA